MVGEKDKVKKASINQYVQYGCGFCAPSSWRNFDASPTLRLQRLPLIGRRFSSDQHPKFPANIEYGDIVEGLPVAAESCKAIYCSHVLEHLALDDLRVALNNTYSYLERDGIFRFVLPDLEKLARTYLDSDDVNASLWFMRQSYLGKESRPKGVKGLLRTWLGNSNHLWMWDFKAISVELEQAGFRKIRRAGFGDSQEPLFRDVEEPGRWKEDYLGVEGIDCLGVECTK